MSKPEQLPALLSAYGELAVEQSSILALEERDNCWWMILRGRAGAVEGKLYLPKSKTSRLLIFTPGFPGGGSTDLERWHVEGLLATGLAVFNIRHNGTIANGSHSEYYINCPERQERARQKKSDVIGETGRRYSIGDWLTEPLIALECLSPSFSDICLGAHSFGALATLYSTIELARREPERLPRVKRLLLLAGAMGRIRSQEDGIIKMWTDILGSPWEQERLRIGEAASNLDHLQAAYERIHRSPGLIPATVEVICVNPWGDTTDSLDEYIAPQEALDLLLTLGHGTIIVDKTQRAEPEKQRMAHDMEALSTATLLRLVDPEWKPEKQVYRLDSGGLS